jgi:hypothetical protein
MNVIRDIETTVEKVSQLIRDLSCPAQNPAFKGPSNEEITEVLNNVIDVLTDAQVEIDDLNCDLSYYQEVYGDNEEEE